MKTFIFRYHVARHICGEHMGMVRHFNVELAWSILISQGILDYESYVYLGHTIVEETADQYASRLTFGNEDTKVTDYSMLRESSHALCICNVH